MAMNAREFIQTDVVLLGFLLYSFLGKTADWLARLLESCLSIKDCHGADVAG